AQKDRTIMNCHRLLLATLALAATLAAPAAAQAPQSWTLVGRLDCQVDPNVGFIIVGHQSMRCLFIPNAPIPQEAYAGALNTVGLNVGISAGGVLGWAVFAPTTGLSPERSPENMSAFPEMLALAWVLAPTSSLAVPTAPLRFSRFRFRVRSH